MIYQKSKRDGTEFFDELDYYMEMARGVGKRTANYLYKLKASCDPLCFMQGGFDGGTLEADECIEPVLKKSTISFGYGGLHELTMLHLKKKLSEDSSFAVETMKHINENIERYKQEDHLIWAIYGRSGCRIKTIKLTNRCLGINSRLTVKAKCLSYANTVPKGVEIIERIS